MKKHHILLVLLCTLFSFGAVGQIKLKKKAEKKANQVIDDFLFGKKKKKAAENSTSTPTPGIPTSAPGAGDSSGEMDNYTPSPVDWEGLDVGSTIHFSTLINMLPERTQGFSRSDKPEGAMYSTAGFKYSTGMKQYRNGDRELNISLSDYLGVEYLVAAQSQQYEYESTDGFTKSIEANGMRGWITMEYSNNEGSLVLTKGGRVLLSINAENTSETELRSILNDVDLSKLPIE